MRKPFTQVNVFSADPLGGNPLAVVRDAEGLSEAQMAALARWTNLSETTFLLPATDPGADYYVRIFTPGGELPFAGHPTLGSCHAWLAAGGKPRKPDVVVQQCGVGLGRCAVMLASARQVQSLKPDWALLDPLKLGVVGPHDTGHDADFEVRAFVGGGGYEDPVTGSLNASLAQWLIGAALAKSSYIAAQGAALQRAGRVHLRKDGEEVWVGGDVVDVIRGEINL